MHLAAAELVSDGVVPLLCRSCYIAFQTDEVNLAALPVTIISDSPAALSTDARGGQRRGGRH